MTKVLFALFAFSLSVQVVEPIPTFVDGPINLVWEPSPTEAADNIAGYYVMMQWLEFMNTNVTIPSPEYRWAIPPEKRVVGGTYDIGLKGRTRNYTSTGTLWARFKVVAGVTPSTPQNFRMSAPTLLRQPGR